MSIFDDFIEDIMEVFMDKFFVFGDSFNSYFLNLENILIHFDETNLVLSWEKCHFIFLEEIVLVHKISKLVIEVDKAKIESIEELYPLVLVKAIWSFLGHIGFH